MDESVLRALDKWPNVPAVFGWLALDRRGRWNLKDEIITHQNFIDFINRNYEKEATGAYYFQNGPQKVYVDLEYTPWIYHWSESDGKSKILTHTGLLVENIKSIWLDEWTNILFETEHGVGLFDDNSITKLLPFFVNETGEPISEEELESQLSSLSSKPSTPLYLFWRNQNFILKSIQKEQVSTQFHFIPHPQKETLT